MNPCYSILPQAWSEFAGKSNKQTPKQQTNKHIHTHKNETIKQINKSTQCHEENQLCYILKYSSSVTSYSANENSATFLKVHFVIHSLIPPFFSRKVEIFTSAEAFRYMMLLCKIFLANSFVWWNNRQNCLFFMSTLRYSKTCIAHKRNFRIDWKFGNELIILSTEIIYVIKISCCYC